MELFKKRKIEEVDKLSEKIELESNTSSIASNEILDAQENVLLEDTVSFPETVFKNQNLENPEMVTKERRSRKSVITERLVSTLDKCKVSDRQAVHIICAVAVALGEDLTTLVINRSSIRRCRQDVRKKKAEKIKEEFKNVALNAAVIHWDGKLLPALTGKETIDRLPIVITNGDIEQILHVPILENSTGKAQAEAIFEVLRDWGLENTIKACCFDTTAANTGPYNGACVLLEQLLETSLLYLPCRHHILEIIIKSVFEQGIPGTSCPSVPLFKKCQEFWPKIDKTKFLPGIAEKEISEIFSDDKAEIIKYLQTIVNHLRDDYKEFAQLCMIFLGESQTENIFFYYPGAMHHARWMAKVIYSLKIFLFRKEFKLKASVEKALSEICIFIVKIYTSTFSAHSPRSNLNLIKNLYEYKKKNEHISKIALEKCLRHLWYLSPEAVAFSFFDEYVPFEVKRKMCQKILEKDESDEESVLFKRVNLKYSDLEDIVNRDLEQFVCSGTKRFFTRFNINSSFLNEDPSKWIANKEYQRGKDIIDKIKVRNDTAERGVKRIEEYNDKLSTKEDQKQFILQVVSNYRKCYPDFKKQTLTSSL